MRGLGAGNGFARGATLSQSAWLAPIHSRATILTRLGHSAAGWFLGCDLHPNLERVKGKLSTPQGAAAYGVSDKFTVEHIGARNGDVRNGLQCKYYNPQGKKITFQIGAWLDRHKWSAAEEAALPPQTKVLREKLGRLYEEHVGDFLERRGFPKEVSEGLGGVGWGGTEWKLPPHARPCRHRCSKGWTSRPISSSPP